MDENRRDERLPADIPVQALLPGGGEAVACRMLDVSWRGARLRMPDVNAVPDRFEILGNAAFGPLPVEVVWRTADEVGIVYL